MAAQWLKLRGQRINTFVVLVFSDENQARRLKGPFGFVEGRAGHPGYAEDESLLESGQGPKIAHGKAVDKEEQLQVWWGGWVSIDELEHLV